jgi:excisionase family DNA binding protein
MTKGFSKTEAWVKLWDVRAVAEMLGCSSRHVYRLSDAGRMPAPIKLGALVRWSAAAIQEWIDQGCPSVRKMKGTER